jgi:hypothetical protein
MKKQSIPQLPETSRLLRQTDVRAARALIQSAMKSRGVTIRSLADGMDISKSSVGNLLTGKGEWSPALWSNAWTFIFTVPFSKPQPKL